MPLRRLGRGFHLRGFIGGFLLFPAAAISLFSSPLFSHGSWLELLVRGLAWVAFAFGIMFRCWSTLYVGGRKRMTLVQDGPYSVTRNPLYVGSLFNALAAALFLQSITFLALAAIVALAYFTFTIPAEEQDLRQIHGAAFDDYCRTVPRFWPNLRRFHSPPVVQVTLKGLRLECKRAAVWFLLPVAGDLALYLRHWSAWPHLFPIG